MAVKERKYKKKKLGNYPFISVVFSITIALSVIGLFGLLLIFTGKLTKSIQENVEIQVFLTKGLSSNEITKISKTLSSKDYILLREGVPQLTTISKEAAAKQFSQETGEDFINFLGDNPLRDVIVLKITQEYHSAENLLEIKKEIEFIRGVYEVSYVESLVNSINENLAKVGLILVIIFSVVLLGVVILIHNTIKLALFSQRFLIRSMQLVGATAAFIQRPFLIRSFFYGIVSGFFTVLLLSVFLNFINSKVSGLSELQSMKELFILGGVLMTLGAIVGFISTFAATRKYLKLSLDELY
ncbi:MAG: cell division transport system permease protein [Cyclobacteriaceae bacterium]|jgi:cell division transport system permease protein